MVSNVESVPIMKERPTEQQPPRKPHRSWRIVRQLDRFMSGSETYEAEAIGHNDDNPCTYDEAIEDVDANLWKNAMNTEMESMDSNKVWSLWTCPKG